MDMEDQLQVLCGQWHAADDESIRATIEAAYDHVLRAVKAVGGIVDLNAELPFEHMPAWYREQYPEDKRAVWTTSVYSRQLSPEDLRKI